jgi:serine-type D-Ala-D-Ala carboxypeptidase (penicillin-binding protein 5/6)
LKQKLIVLLITLSVLSLFNMVFADEFYETETVSSLQQNEAINVTKGIIPQVDAASAIVVDNESGRILFEKNAHVRKNIASTTKIMTAIVAIENSKTDEIVEISQKAASVWGSDIGLKKGEKYTMLDLLYGLLLNSGNDASIAIAEHVAGSEQEFVMMMNEKAREIGAKDTSFVTPHGLDAAGHYSTAYDLTLITRYAMKNKLFSKIVATKAITISGGKHFVNTNEMLQLYPGADGVKTGYTGIAGRCLVTSANRGNRKYISVVLGCASRTIRASSSKKILDYCFENYTNETLIKQGEIVGKINVKRGLQKSVNVLSNDTLVFPMTKNEKEKLEKKIELPSDMYSPIQKDISVGKVAFIVEGKTLLECNLYSQDNVEKKNYIDYLNDVSNGWIKSCR